MIMERTQAGKEVAKTKPGFKDGRPRIAKNRIDAALSLVDAGNSYNKVAELTNIGVATLYRARARKKAEELVALH